jgi:hypothetical protein
MTGTIVLLDTSGSMVELSGVQRRIDALRAILCTVLPDVPGSRLFAFDSVVRELDGPDAIPEPGGGTMLAEALEHIAPLHPARVIIVSDGEPHSAAAALNDARALNCFIATYYCGDEDNHAAVAFLRALSWCSTDGLGHAAVSDLRKPERLEAELRLALTGPAR